jgi:hypothetical protein
LGTHAIENCFGCDDDRAFLSIFAGADRLSDRFDRNVSANMVGIGARVGKVANRLVGQRAIAATTLALDASRSRIDDEHSLRTNATVTFAPTPPIMNTSEAT